MCWFVPLGAAAMGTSAAAAGTAAATAQALVGASITASVGSSALSFIGQQQQAKQQEKYQRIASRQEAERLQQEQTAIRIKQDQENQARQNELFELKKRTDAAVASATVAAGEAGVAGTSADLLLGDYYRSMGNYETALLREQGFQDVATGLATQDAISRSGQRQTGILRPINRPSVLEGIASVGSSYLQGQATGMQIARTRGDLT